MQNTRRLSDSTVRAAAKRVGLAAKKSRERANVPNFDNFGDYMLVDAQSGWVVAGSRFDLTPAGVLEFCESYGRRVG